MAKVFTFRGKTAEELQNLSFEEFAKLLPSRQRRALLKRGMTEEEKKVFRKFRKSRGKFIKTQTRDMIIVPEMIGLKFGIHNGKEWVTVDIKAEMVGHRLGEFSQTRKRVLHSAPGIGATKSSKFVPLK
ncbi:MAG: 30S ribosomal protein S19 [Candidatus Aenigmatarchaeota archaeon]